MSVVFFEPSRRFGAAGGRLSVAPVTIVSGLFGSRWGLDPFWPRPAPFSRPWRLSLFPLVLRRVGEQSVRSRLPILSSSCLAAPVPSNPCGAGSRCRQWGASVGPRASVGNQFPSPGRLGLPGPVYVVLELYQWSVRFDDRTEVDVVHASKGYCNINGFIREGLRSSRGARR